MLYIFTSFTFHTGLSYVFNIKTLFKTISIPSRQTHYSVFCPAPSFWYLMTTFQHSVLLPPSSMGESNLPRCTSWRGITSPSPVGGDIRSLVYQGVRAPARRGHGTPPYHNVQVRSDVCMHPLNFIEATIFILVTQN